MAGTGYVGLSLATLLVQRNSVVAVDVVQEKVDLINNHKSPIQDNEIEDFLANRKLNLVETTDDRSAYKDSDFVIIATPTNYDPKLNFFDTRYVEQVIEEEINKEKNDGTIILPFENKTLFDNCQKLPCFKLELLEAEYSEKDKIIENTVFVFA